MSSINITDTESLNDHCVGEQDVLVGYVAAYFNETTNEVLATEPGKSKLSRLVAIALSKVHCKKRNATISTWFGISRSAVSVGLRKILMRTGLWRI